VKKKQYDDSSNCSEHSAATGNYFAVTLWFMGTRNYGRMTGQDTIMYDLSSNWLIATVNRQKWLKNQQRCLTKIKIFTIWNTTIRCLVPHSQCSLRENPKFLQNFRPKNNKLKGNVWLLFSYNIYQRILGLIFKYILLYHKIVCIMQDKFCKTYVRNDKFCKTYFRNVSKICEWGTWAGKFSSCLTSVLRFTQEKKEQVWPSRLNFILCISTLTI
jgi:hypothetical protein